MCFRLTLFLTHTNTHSSSPTLLIWLKNVKNRFSMLIDNVMLTVKKMLNSTAWERSTRTVQSAYMLKMFVVYLQKKAAVAIIYWLNNYLYEVKMKHMKNSFYAVTQRAEQQTAGETVLGLGPLGLVTLKSVKRVLSLEWLTPDLLVTSCWVLDS